MTLCEVPLHDGYKSSHYTSWSVFPKLSEQSLIQTVSIEEQLQW